MLVATGLATIKPGPGLGHVSRVNGGVSVVSRSLPQCIGVDKKVQYKIPIILKTMAINVTIRQLRAFVSVARNGSFTRASQELRISQPTLTTSVRHVEEALGVSLFDRTTRTVRLTADGAEFLPVVERLLGDFDAALSDMQALGERRRGRVIVACLPSLAVRLIAPIIPRFARAYPGIVVMLRDGNAGSVVRRVLTREADFGVSSHWEDEPDLAFTPLLHDRYCVVCPADHELVQHNTLRLGDLEGFPFLAMSMNTGIRPHVERAVAKADVKLDVVCEISQLSTLGGMIEAGLGISVVPELATPITAHHGIVTRPLVEPVIEREIGLITRAGRSLSPAAETFREAILEQVADMRPESVKGERPKRPARKRR